MSIACSIRHSPRFGQNIIIYNFLGFIKTQLSGVVPQKWNEGLTYEMTLILIVWMCIQKITQV